MKIQSRIIAALLALSVIPVFGQEQPLPAQRLINQRAQRMPISSDPNAAQSVVVTSGLTKFNLDFPGGKPRELVAAIQKALGKPLNVIVPENLANVKLPPLKMNNVNVHELFIALNRASAKQEAVVTGTTFGGLSGYGGGPNRQYTYFNTSYGFKVEGTPTDDSIWYFYEDRPVALPDADPSSTRVSRFYLLTPYLDQGLTVDDITTAIKTGWTMLGETDPPKISFHKETKLLIAVGDESKLATISAVLHALEPPSRPNSALPVMPPRVPKPKSDE